MNNHVGLWIINFIYLSLFAKYENDYYDLFHFKKQLNLSINLINIINNIKR